jgi:hypothetical protein
MEGEIGGTYNAHGREVGVINLYENVWNLKGKRQHVINRGKIGG